VTAGGLFTVTGALTWSGLLTITNTNLSATGTLTGPFTPSIVINDGTPNFTGATFTNAFSLTMTQTTATARTFTGGGLTYINYVRNGSGSGTTIIDSSNTFTTFTDNAGLVAHTLTFTSGTTQTAASFALAGASGKILTLNSSTPASAATLHRTDGLNTSAGFLSIQDSTVDASPLWEAANSTNVSGNTNWIFVGNVAGGDGGDSLHTGHQTAIRRGHNIRK